MAEAVSRISQVHEWDPVYWIGTNSSDAQNIRERFPGAQFQRKIDAVRGRFPKSVPCERWPVRDPNIIQDLAKYDPVLHPVFLRYAKATQGMQQHAEYHEVITNWRCFFDYIDPGLVLFGNIPDDVPGFLSYLLCLERGISVLLLLRPMQLPDVILPTNRLDEPAPRVVSQYQSYLAMGGVGDLQLDDKWKKYVERMRGTYDEAMYQGFAKRYMSKEGGDRIKLRWNLIGKTIDVGRRIVHGKNYKVQGRALLSEIKSIPTRWILRRSYERRAIEPDYTVPYVFVALHVQPERTSIPQGGVFAHQLLMVECLSRALPEGWMLYVKEHPVQLHTRPGNRAFRTPAFYKELQRFPNVQLVPSMIASRKLLENCQAVASATSTACWEGIFLGKPAIVFGSVFFTFFEGVFPVRSCQQCEYALNAIRSGYRVNQDRVHACIRAIQDQGLPVPPSLEEPENEAHEQLDKEAEWRIWTGIASEQIGRNGDVSSYMDPAP